MFKCNIKGFSCIFLASFSCHALANDTIEITVKTDEKTAAGIGYSVKGKNFGSVGRSYKGEGPGNKQYTFGYKKDSLAGKNISCGTLILTKNTLVNLIMEKNTCHCSSVEVL